MRVATDREREIYRLIGETLGVIIGLCLLFLVELF